MEINTTINSYSLTIKGLSIKITEDGLSTHLMFDPYATVEILKQCGYIEEYADDSGTWDPVIFYSFKINGTEITGFSHWVQFYRSFLLNAEIVTKILEQQKKQYLIRNTGAKVISMYQPLQAA